MFFLLLLVFSTGFSQKQIALTFDDLPMASPRISLQHTIDINQKLLSTLKEQHVPAIGFVNESMLEVDNKTAERVNILRLWVNQGYDLGNHTYSHVDYNFIPYSAFLQEFKKGEIYTKKVLQEKNKKIKFFRPAFLSTGSTLKKKLRLEKLLQDNGYTMALSTIESSDFTFNLIYLQAKFQQDSAGMRKVVKDYLDFTEKKLVYFESVTDKVVGTSIPQILLVHANDINADNLELLLQLLREHHYEFTSLEKALQNPVYSQKYAYVDKRGISWLHRWNTQNRQALMRQEPRIPENIKTQNEVAKRYQFFFLLKSRVMGYNYTAFHIGLFLITAVLFVAFIYLVLVRRKRKIYYTNKTLDLKLQKKH